MFQRHIKRIDLVMDVTFDDFIEEQVFLKSLYQNNLVETISPDQGLANIPLFIKKSDPALTDLPTHTVTLKDSEEKLFFGIRNFGFVKENIDFKDNNFQNIPNEHISTLTKILAGTGIDKKIFKVGVKYIITLDIQNAMKENCIVLKIGDYEIKDANLSFTSFIDENEGEIISFSDFALGKIGQQRKPMSSIATIRNGLSYDVNSAEDIKTTIENCLKEQYEKYIKIFKNEN